MDSSETVASNHLAHLGFRKIAFEPEGRSKPPDFLVDGRIAVEVRRLNQNESCSPPGTKPRGLEEVAIPVWKNVHRVLCSLGAPNNESSWYVSVRYSRPIPGQRQIEDSIRHHLAAFRDSPRQTPTSIQISDNFSVTLSSTGRRHKHCFVMGGVSDSDSGGWVIPELERNLKICIDHKTKKISGIRAKYPEWWLVLIDHINYGIEEALHVPPHNWDKIVLISPLDHTQAFEVK